jgi:acyl carrier protein
LIGANLKAAPAPPDTRSFPHDRRNPMEREEALSALREVAVEVLSVEPDAVVEEARFKEDLDADSLDLVELVMGLEERFDISVPEEDLENVGTVGQAVDLVMAKVAAKA